MNLHDLSATELKTIQGGEGDDPRTITILGNTIYIGGTGPLIPNK